MTELLTLLRIRTNAQHEQLHVHPLLAPLQDAAITRADYHWCIRAFHAAYTHIEQAYPKAGATHIPAREWLENDLRQHALTPLALPTVQYPPINTLSKHLGALYVMQGSTLGGRVITKHLNHTLGLIEYETNHFFAGFGDETGPRWKAFLTLLDNPEIDTAEATDQALHTFRVIAECCDAALAAKRAGNYSAAVG